MATKQPLEAVTKVIYSGENAICTKRNVRCAVSCIMLVLLGPTLLGCGRGLTFAADWDAALSLQICADARQSYASGTTHIRACNVVL